MSFMSEISEEFGEQCAYKNVLNKLNELEKKYVEKYMSNIPEMYVEIFDDIIGYLKERIK